MALANVILYNQAALMEQMLQWWNLEAEHCWVIEQLGLKYPLSEMALNISYLPDLKVLICMLRF